VTTIYLADVKKELDRLVKAETATTCTKIFVSGFCLTNRATAFIAAEPRSIDKIKFKSSRSNVFQLKEQSKLH